MASPLPRFVVIKPIKYPVSRCLRYVNEDGEIHGFLKFYGEKVVSPYSKFEVEIAKTGKGLVHLRCCYNNKYWARNSLASEFIIAGGDEPEEDQSKWSCTLFEPINIDAQMFRLRHVQLGYYVRLWEPGYTEASNWCASAASASIDPLRGDILTIIDWESLLILPKHVAFKGDDGTYLSALVLGDSGISDVQHSHPYLQFASRDIGDPKVRNEVFNTPVGSVRIKSDYYGKFWRCSLNWIWCDTNDTTNGNLETLFWPIQVDSNIVALRNVGNNNFCKRLTADGKTSCLNAGISTISKETHLEVHELVISRKIYNVDFRLMDARIYDQQVLTMADGNAINNTQETNTVNVKLAYTESKSSMWDASVSLKLGVKTNIQTGIPFIAEGKIEISAELTKSYEWGSTESSTAEIETVYEVSVPPMSTVKLSLLATKGSCDVPFSYAQSDTLTNGQQITYNMDDGVYSGINCFNFKYETKQEAL